MCIWPRCCGGGNVIKIQTDAGVFKRKAQYQKSVVTRSFYEFIKENKPNLPDSWTLQVTRQSMHLSTNASPSGTVGRDLYCLRTVDYGDYFVCLTYVASGPDVNIFAIQKWSYSGTVLQEVLILTSGFTWDYTSKNNMFLFWDEDSDACGFVVRSVTGTFPGSVLNLTKYTWFISDGSSFGTPATSATPFFARIDIADSSYAGQNQHKLYDTLYFADSSSDTRIVSADFMTDSASEIGDFTTILHQEPGTTNAVRNLGTKHEYTYLPTVLKRVDLDGDVETDIGPGTGFLDEFGQFLRNSGGRTQRYIEGTGWEDYVIETDYTYHTIEVHPSEDTPIDPAIISAGAEGLAADYDVSLLKIGTVPVDEETSADLLISGSTTGVTGPGFRSAIYTPGISAIVPYQRTGGILVVFPLGFSGVIPVADGVIIILDAISDGTGDSNMGQLLTRFGYFTLVPPQPEEPEEPEE